MATVYQVNKGINRSIEFKGIKAQYIIYLACGMVGLLLAFAILYVIGLNTYLCLGIIIPAAAGLYVAVQHFSKKYGEHGLLNHSARKLLPRCIRATSRKCFTQLSEKDYENEKKNVGKRSSRI
jgi:hypothetical protein